MTSHVTESDASAVRLLGADPWMRFDLWSSRAWDAAEKAATVAAEIGAPMNSNDDLDPRVITLFHAVTTAKDFAAMTNPLFAVSGHECVKEDDAIERAYLEAGMLSDED